MKQAVLWRQILNGGLRWPPKEQKPRDVETEREIIAGPIIIAPPMPSMEATWLELAGLSIPFDRFWIEGDFNTSDGNAGGIAKHRWGCLIHASQRDYGFSVDAVCCHSKPDEAIGPERMGDVSFDLDKGGTPIRDRFWCAVPTWLRATAPPEIEDDLLRAWLAAPALAAGMALMILGCKNVSLSPRDNEPKQVRRAVKRHGGSSESYRYHVLVVRPPGKHADSSAATHEIGVMPSHVRRGHFAEYGCEFNKGLLFGKYSGRFYVPQMVVGDKKRGVVEKDYQIAASHAL